MRTTESLPGEHCAMSRQTFTDRRRAQLARRVGTLEAMEPRSMITESLGILTLGIGVPTLAATIGSHTAEKERQAAQGPVMRLDARAQAQASLRATQVGSSRPAANQAGWQNAG